MGLSDFGEDAGSEEAFPEGEAEGAGAEGEARLWPEQPASVPRSMEAARSRASLCLLERFFLLSAIMILLSLTELQIYPFTEPTIIPFTKYFCKKGYTTRIGSVEATMVAVFSDMVGSHLLEES